MKHKKWLIFVTNIRKGKELAQQLCAVNKKRLKPDKKASAGKYALFLDRKSRYDTDEVSGKMWANIEKNMSFSPHVLITTSVLDNGITLNDKKLKNIVLYTDDRTKFIQEIGMMMGVLQKLRDTKDPSGCNFGGEFPVDSPCERGKKSCPDVFRQQSIIAVSIGKAGRLSARSWRTSRWPIRWKKFPHTSCRKKQKNGAAGRYLSPNIKSEQHEE